MHKVSFTVGFTVGYVLGTRAGRDRYESLARGVRNFKDNPAVQGAAGVLQAQAAGQYTRARSAAATRARDAVSERLHSFPAARRGV